MEDEFSIAEPAEAGHTGKKVAQPSTDKALRTMLLAVLFQVSWPVRLTRKDIIEYLSVLYGENPWRALYRDIETLTDTLVDDLPEPDAEHLSDWCNQQQQRKRLAITYERRTFTFGLAQSIFSIDISEDEARAFVALQEGFTPGTPYADAVQQLLIRWEWLFSEKSHQLVRQKRKRHARPVLLPLSPVVDYSQHGDTILLLDQALEEGAYVSFAYTPLAQSWDDEPMLHDQAHRIARRLVSEFAARDPDLYLVSAQARREGRIFLDYLRNGRGTTAIGTYSPRVREGFPIAAPTTWPRIEAGIRPDAFTMKSPFRARSNTAN